MYRAPRCWSILSVFAVVFTLMMPALATSTVAQDDGNVLRVHRSSWTTAPGR